jgi:copper chaperone CopZ
MERIDVQVNGMSCGHCEETVGKAVSRLAGVRAVEADHASGRVSIQIDGELDRRQLAEAISEAGYELVPA